MGQYDVHHGTGVTSLGPVSGCGVAMEAAVGRWFLLVPGFSRRIFQNIARSSALFISTVSCGGHCGHKGMDVVSNNTCGV